MNKKILHLSESKKKSDDPNLQNLEEFDSNEIALILSANTQVLMKHWIKFQQEWVNNIFKQFKDYDKYIVLIYLLSKSWEDDLNLYKFHSMNEYYSKEEIRVPNISLVKLSEDLKMPRETVRRKLIELEKKNYIKRKSEKIILSKSALNLQKPDNSIKNISIFLEKLSILLSAHDWFGPSINRGDVELYFKKYYTIVWSSFFKLQIPFLIRWKTIFGDLESFVIWGNMGINQNISLEKNNNIKFEKEEYIENIINMTDIKVNKSIRGINASSIAEISSIPRATVFRKLNKL